MLRKFVTLAAALRRGLVVGALGLAQFGPGAVAAVDSVPGITVEAQRASERLKLDVDTFLSAALVHPLSDESLIRWDHAMCPLVAGLTREEGEFILRRVSDIARSVHAPLGKENCNPNFLVIVARNPSVFLKLLWNRKPRMFDTHYGIAPVKRFIETSRPIRVWYDFYVRPSDQTTVFSSMFSSLLAESEAHGTTGVAYPIYMHPSFTGTHLPFPVVRDFAATIILNVFRASATSPPSELTPWDRAMLSALYSTHQGDRMQVSKMQDLAVNYIASTAPHQ